LRVLEHSAAQPIVTPAYRLRAIDGPSDSASGAFTRGAGPAPVLTVVGADQLPRPALAFLGADPGIAATEPGEPQRLMSDPYPQGGDHMGASHVGAVTIHAPLGDSLGRHLARQRRRHTLGVLTMVFVGTGLVGFVPGAGAAWLLTAISGAALGAYVALLVHLRRMADERERKLRYLRPGVPGGPGMAGTLRAASYMSGRYAHPSNQAAAVP
jgi:hypothetical protein